MLNFCKRFCNATHMACMFSGIYNASILHTCWSAHLSFNLASALCFVTPCSCCTWPGKTWLPTGISIAMRMGMQTGNPTSSTSSSNHWPHPAPLGHPRNPGHFHKIVLSLLRHRTCRKQMKMIVQNKASPKIQHWIHWSSVPDTPVYLHRQGKPLWCESFHVYEHCQIRLLWSLSPLN